MSTSIYSTCRESIRRAARSCADNTTKSERSRPMSARWFDFDRLDCCDLPWLIELRLDQTVCREHDYRKRRHLSHPPQASDRNHNENLHASAHRILLRAFVTAVHP